jgi:hypothetical protein
MMIDSHCHLNYKGLIEISSAVLARARARGVTGMLNISTREREWDDIIATAEREPDVWATVGIHPHEADAASRYRHRQADRAAQRIPRSSASARPGSIIITIIRIAIGSAPASAPISPHRAKPACRSSSTRAMPRTIRPRSCATRWGRGPSPADPLLHRERPFADIALELGFISRSPAS